jgi:hypothetical protein
MRALWDTKWKEKQIQIQIRTYSHHLISKVNLSKILEGRSFSASTKTSLQSAELKLMKKSRKNGARVLLTKNFCRLLILIITIRVNCLKTYLGQEKFSKFSHLRCKQIIIRIFMSTLMKIQATLSILKIISVEDYQATMIPCFKARHHL